MSDQIQEQPSQVPAEKAAAPTPDKKAKAPLEAAWLTRLKAEVKDLEDKHGKLTEFLAGPLLDEVPEIQKSLLRSQHTFQTLLLDVLKQRVEAA